jgi:hypothetical protein
MNFISHSQAIVTNIHAHTEYHRLPPEIWLHWHIFVFAASVPYTPQLYETQYRVGAVGDLLYFLKSSSIYTAPLNPPGNRSPPSQMNHQAAPPIAASFTAPRQFDTHFQKKKRKEEERYLHTLSTNRGPTL